MNIFRYLPEMPRRIERREAEIAAMLRQLANRVENGEVSDIVVTVIRKGGGIEHLSDTPTTDQTS